ncbi:hypothetical protein L1049_015541 [Liquidambar formosana]|uniref:Uncharacterized protein n=1 Tax=Liquidambar formosana TaxID=63359 RepID=A0AAP0RXQ8_LIQFO
MVPDKPAEQQEEASRPASAATVAVEASHPPRKRLLAGGGPKPNKGFQSPPDCPAPCSKKTRELPNLSECHNCGYRINTSNGKDRLQTLYSEWRIVLLCKSCFDRVESAELCPYCFTETSQECLRCRNCSRAVHRDCVSQYKGFAPWSYAHSDLGFTICVDCWIPKSIVKLRSREFSKRVSRRRGKICKSGKNIPVCEDGGDSLEDVVKDANCGLEKKVAVAARAREEAVRKAVVAKRAVELANCALDLVAKRDENGVNGNAPRVVDDAELAFQLHRAMNSSRRISKNLCLLNSSCLVVSEMWDCNGSLSNRASGFRENQENGRDGGDDKVEVPLKEEEGSCSNKLINSSGDDNSMDSESQSCGKHDELGHELHSNGNGNQCQLKCDIKPDRYLLKYRKRNTRSKEILASAPGILLNCSKESRTSSDPSFQSCTVPLQASACASGSSQDQS